MGYHFGISGFTSIPLLASLGYTDLRTWGVDQLSTTVLEDATRNNVGIWAGLWVSVESGTEDGNRSAIENAKSQVMQFRGYSCIRLWIIGNEIELRYPGGNNEQKLVACANLIERIAQAIRTVDSRPLACCVADVGGGQYPPKAAIFSKYCPSIEVLGVNCYGGIVSLDERLTQQGFTGKYALLECGVGGHWEAPKTPWGAPIEMSSTDKAYMSWKHGLCDNTRCDPRRIGTFTFFGGAKQEGTVTWYNLFSPEDSNALPPNLPISDRLLASSPLFPYKDFDQSKMPRSELFAEAVHALGIPVCLGIRVLSQAATQPSGIRHTFHTIKSFLQGHRSQHSEHEEDSASVTPWYEGHPHEEILVTIWLPPRNPSNWIPLRIVWELRPDPKVLWEGDAGLHADVRPLETILASEPLDGTTMTPGIGVTADVASMGIPHEGPTQKPIDHLQTSIKLPGRKGTYRLYAFVKIADEAVKALPKFPNLQALPMLRRGVATASMPLIVQ